MAEPSLFLSLRICGSCGRIEPAARYFCANCGSAELRPAPIEGSGKLLSWTVVRRPAAAFQHLGSIPIAVVALDAGVNITGRFEGDPMELTPGMPVTLSSFGDGVATFRRV
jgi:uncharacterized protein